MAGGGWRSEFEEVRAQQALLNVLTQRDAFMNKVAKRVDEQGAALRWLTDEYQGKHMSQRDHFESSTKYNAIVLGVGYAGFFGLWSMVSHQGHEYPKLHALAALLIAASLTLFVLWEVYSMFINTVTLSRPRSLSPEPRRWLRGVHFCYDGLEKAWMPTFVVTLVTGLAGIGCLSWILIANVLKVFSD